MPYVIAILVLLLIVIIIANIKIVPQAHAYVMERLGAYHVHLGNRPACQDSVPG